MAAPPTQAEQQLATRLRQLREGLRVTQAELADMFKPFNQGRGQGRQDRSVGAASISSWENSRRPASPPQFRLEPYARLVATNGLLVDGKPVPVTDLPEAERAKYDAVLRELGQLWEAARDEPQETPASEEERPRSYRSWFFDDDGPVTIICPEAPEEARGPLADPADPNFTSLHAYADLDSIVELFGHIRAENDASFPVAFRLATELRADDLSGHVVLLGGVAWNPATKQLLRALTWLPVSQTTVDDLDSGEIFVSRDGDESTQYYPVWESDDESDQKTLIEDVALLARVRNPFNSNRTLTICNGIHSRGVLGAVRTLTDARVRDANESYLAERFGESGYAVLMRVPVYSGEAISPDLTTPHNRLFEWSGPEAAVV